MERVADWLQCADRCEPKLGKRGSHPGIRSKQGHVQPPLTTGALDRGFGHVHVRISFADVWPLTEGGLVDGRCRRVAHIH